MAIRKVEHAGFVETPRIRRPRRKSQFPEEDSYDSSSATDNAPTKGTRAGTPGREAKANGHAEKNHTMDRNPTRNGVTRPRDANQQDKIDAIKQGQILDGWVEGLDPKIDYSGKFEFGGSLGVSTIMVGFTLIMYYMWIGATYYDGKLPLPQQGQTIGDFINDLGNMVYEGAYPSLKAWTIYWTFFVCEMAFYCLLPGVWAYGKPLPHEGGRQLKYYCSGVWSFYTTIVVTAALHFSGLFPLYTLLDEFGPLMSVAMISGYLVAAIAYFSALIRGAQHRMTGYPIYDFFMGAELNPRMFGILDFKMFFEVRLPWYILFLLSCAAAARQYEQFGYISGEVGFLVMAHFLYANACSKGEECIVTTW